MCAVGFVLINTDHIISGRGTWYGHEVCEYTSDMCLALPSVTVLVF